jgi:hypothetical protein
MILRNNHSPQQSFLYIATNAVRTSTESFPLRAAVAVNMSLFSERKDDKLSRRYAENNQTRIELAGVLHFGVPGRDGYLTRRAFMLQKSNTCVPPYATGPMQWAMPSGSRNTVPVEDAKGPDSHAFAWARVSQACAVALRAGSVAAFRPAWPPPSRRWATWNRPRWPPFSPPVVDPLSSAPRLGWNAHARPSVVFGEMPSSPVCGSASTPRAAV